jgi:hypothetical protein
MFSFKVVVATLLAAITLSAAANSASADWYVGATKLATTAAVSNKAHVDRLLGFRIPFTMTTVTCEGNATTLLEIAGAIIIAETHPLLGGFVLGALIAEHCSLVGAKGCELSEPKVTTEPLDAQITDGPGEEDRAVFLPQKGKTITTFDFVGTACALAGEHPLTGSFTMKLPTGEKEGALQAIEGLGSVENNSLQLGGEKAYVEGGDILLALSSGTKFSNH